MTKALRKSSRGVATGATATGATAAGATAAGAASFGVVALGAVALGAIAVGALAVGRLTVGRARLRRVEIGELAVGRLAIGAYSTGGKLTAVARIHAAPGSGDALERLLLEEVAGSDPGSLLYRAHRSRIDPDSFLFCESYADELAFEDHAGAPRLDTLLRQAAALGLVGSGDPVEIELYRAI